MFEDIIELIKQVSEDKTVPRNIRERCLESIEILKTDKYFCIRKLPTTTSYFAPKHPPYDVLYRFFFDGKISNWKVL